MLFNDFAFLFFFAPVFAGSLLLEGLPAVRKGLLLAASLSFYMFWGSGWVLLLLATSLLDYAVGLAFDRVERPAARRALLAATLLANLGMLGYFKYSLFLWDSLGGGPVAAGSVLPWSVLRDGRLLIPLGLSFYTFQSMSYSIDRYRREIPACRNPLDFLLFVTFFPQLVAGPILRAREFLPQLTATIRVRLPDITHGLGWVLSGLVKKVLVADRIGEWADAAFAAPASLSLPSAWLGVYAFAAQIYCDFSGYSDIARGLGRMMGYRIPRNFRRPYLAGSPRDLWRRWHITLSQFLRDYLFIPLGGSRRGTARTVLALAATMTLGGLWHGADWTFVLWGAYHGALLILHRGWDAVAVPGTAAGRLRGTRLWPVAAVLGTFHATCAGWVLFRARDLADAGAMFARLVDPRNLTLPGRGAVEAVGLLGLLGASHLGCFDRLAGPRALRRSPVRTALLAGAALAALELYGAPQRDFIYFVF